MCDERLRQYLNDIGNSDRSIGQIWEEWPRESGSALSPVSTTRVDGPS